MPTPRTDPQAETQAERARRRALGEAYALILSFLARRRAAQTQTTTTEGRNAANAV